MTTVNVSVTSLAEFVHRRGDINYRLEEATSSEEGLDTQQKYQRHIQENHPTYVTEKSVEVTLDVEEITLHIAGRADGVKLDSQLYVEEIKTTRNEFELFYESMGSVHMAQAKLYAAILAPELDIEEHECVVTYLHPESDLKRQVSERLNKAELAGFLDATCAVYARFIAELFKRIKARNVNADAQPFPFESYNEEQRRIARHVYVSIRERENLLLEAPTGTGKTVATAFPSLKSMGTGLIDRAIFATARTTGQHIAGETVRKLSESNDALNGITITAKERICFSPGELCAPQNCKFARGYFDRLPKARDALLRQGFADRAAVTRVARAYEVCPWELSLDAAEWMDFIVCDYNYVLDPLVRLKRLITRHFGKVTLLIDEAHRLGERTREMLSASLDTNSLELVVTDAQATPVKRGLRELIEFIRRQEAEHQFVDDDAAVDEVPQYFWTALERAIESILEEGFSSTEDTLYRCLFNLIRFFNVRDRFDPSSYAWFLRKSEKGVELAVRCLAPSRWIEQVVDDYSSSIRFSGTLSPIEIFQECHGLRGPEMRAQSVLDPNRFGICVVADIPTYYRQRTKSLVSVQELIRCVRGVTDGNWLIAFPSYEYLNQVGSGFLDDDAVKLQEPHISLDERAEFIDWMNEPCRRLGLVVMGGVFTESVDYQPIAISGVIAIGPALPPPSLELERVKESFENGYEIAYRQPAMARVIQAAGRVVRGENDRGMVILVDPRFTHQEYKRYFPRHWRPKVTRAAEVQREVAKFFNGTTDSPQLNA